MTFRLLTIWTFYLGLAGLSHGADNPVKELTPSNYRWTEPSGYNVCGLYAVGRALQLSGVSPKMDELWAKDYVGNIAGSSPSELAKAISLHGKVPVLLSGLSVVQLRLLQMPVVANVRRDIDQSVYNHWVCIHPNDHEVIIYDGPTSVRTVSYPEFLASWNGVGLLVGDSSFLGVTVWITRLLSILAFLLVGSVVLRLTTRAGEGILRQFLSISIGCGALVLLACWVSNADLGTHLGAMRSAASAYEKSTVEIVDRARFAELASTGGTLLVDARLPVDYESGTISSAVNIPVFADSDAVNQFMKNVPKTTSILVFCQSESCGYDSIVANKLAMLGFTNVFESKLGYAEYHPQE